LLGIFSVSIPTGSITVEHRRPSDSTGSRFQFQLVRLQSRKRRAFSRASSVSIPTGSITVACSEDACYNICAGFNSNWFDYSLLLATTIFHIQFVSIPTGSITVTLIFRSFKEPSPFQFQLVRLQ